MRDPAFRFVADFEYWLRLGMYGKFTRIPKTLATFRVHPDSGSVKYTGEYMAFEHIKLIDKIFSLRNILPSDALRFKTEAYSSAYYVAGVVCGNKDVSIKRKYFLKALSLSPLSYITHYQDRLYDMLPTFFGHAFPVINAFLLILFRPGRFIHLLKRKLNKLDGES
jgi:hypothetical protein